MNALHELRPSDESCPYPLGEFLTGSPGTGIGVVPLEAAEMPPLFRRLLAHKSDMTSTLEAHHGESIVLRQLARKQDGDSLLRQVLLIGENSNSILEYGAIHIHLNRFSALARQAIVDGRTPLGTVLSRFSVSYESRPQMFFELSSDDQIDVWLELSKPATLYGRQNVLLGPTGPLAEVVEILPPSVA